MICSHLLLAVSAMTAPVVAQSANKAVVSPTTVAAPMATPSVAPNAMIYSADGRRLGRVDHIRSVNGVPVTASVVFASQYVNVPVSTLSARDGGFVSSLKMADLVRR